MKMPRITLLTSCVLAILTTTSQANAADYQIDPAHSVVQFKVRHLGISSVSGSFGDFSGEISYDAKNVAASKTSAAINVASVNTNQAKRDDHLRSCDFFCIEKFAQIKFQSKETKDLGNGKFQVVGELSLHGVSKPVTLDAEFLGEAKGPDGIERAGFSATTTLNRKDFGLSWSKLTETGGVMVGDEIKINLDIEAKKK